MQITNIRWNIDKNIMELPTELDLYDEFDLNDYSCLEDLKEDIDDYLSEKYGVAHDSYEIDVDEDDFDNEEAIVEVTMKVHLRNKNDIAEIQRWTHHIDHAIDIDEWPEITSISDVTVKEIN